MIDEGYAAVSTRRVAAKAGLTPPLVHYYFPTTDDLLLAGVISKLFADRQVEVEPHVVQFLVRRIERSLATAIRVVEKLDRDMMGGVLDLRELTISDVMVHRTKIVMLNADCSFKAIGDSDIDIFWGAYIGTEDEILVAGNLREHMNDIERMRTEAKARKGWIMDTYLLRKHDA